MKKIIALILLIASVLTLASCAGSDVPEGMQLVRGGEDVGYYLYAPEEWTVANLGQISAAYASSVDTSSISYVETEMPDTTVEKYFEESLKEFTIPVTVVEECKETVFGNAESAVSCVYDYTYDDHEFRAMQIFTEFEGRFGIFTFTSFKENISSSEKTQYEYYLEKIDSVKSNFKYVTKKGAEKNTYTEKDEDGYLLVSDADTAGFSLYLPEDFTVDYSSGIVTAHLTDGSTITLTRATSTGVEVGEYFAARKAELENLFGTMTVLAETKSTSLGNSKQAAAYEYTYVYNGTTYHVYQVLGITTFNGYVFTYTAKDENYDTHKDLIDKITEKIIFK